MRSSLLLIFLLISGAIAYGQSTAGELNFSFTSLPNDGNFSPRHVLAVWVEKGDGTFVKTLKLRADRRKQYLYTWNTQSSGNTTDAITGATLNSHETHNLSWNLAGVDGNLVSDGDYKIRVEYTSEHAQGPLLEVNFSKSTDALSLQPSDATYFQNISLAYTPESTTGIDVPFLKNSVRFWPNPANEQLEISLDNPQSQEIQIQLYDLNLKKVAVIFSGRIPQGQKNLTWAVNRNLVKAGTYFIVFQSKNELHAERVIFTE